MNQVVAIGDQQLCAKEINGSRVVAFSDIDRVHKRPKGTARKNFQNNRRHFVVGQDYFILKPTQMPSHETRTKVRDPRTNFVLGPASPREDFSLGPVSPELFEEVQVNGIKPADIGRCGTTFLTESGYLMLVKSFTDDLAWTVQRKLVNTYFRRQEAPAPAALPPLAQASRLIATQAKAQKLMSDTSGSECTKLCNDLQESLTSMNVFLCHYRKHNSEDTYQTIVKGIALIAESIMCQSMLLSEQKVDWIPYRL